MTSAESQSKAMCKVHPKWVWPHCGAPPAEPAGPRSTGPLVDAGSDVMPVPLEAMEVEFSEAPELEQMAWHLIGALPELAWIADYEVRVLWRAKGGDKLGVCTLSRGLLKFFARCDWVIWIAADHVYSGEMTRSQVQALLYHELKHCDRTGPTLSPGIRKHDAEVFVGEVTRFGAWRDELERLERAFKVYDAGARVYPDGLIAGAKDVTPGERE